MRKRTLGRLVITAIILTLVLPSVLFARTSTSKSSKTSRSNIVESAKTQRKFARLRSSRPIAGKNKNKRKFRRASKRRYRYYERFSTSSYANGLTAGDIAAGEDPVVRAAAIDALGNMNGSVVAIDPNTGRILAMVNQKLALSEGAMPCSTIKVAVALAALSEEIVTKDTPVRVSRRSSMNLTRAMAVSNNPYFEAVGRQLGFEKVSHYAQQFGFGELAGYNIIGEHLGTFPDEPISTREGGVGRMCSFGKGINMTPLQLGAMISAIANGGDLYYLQHPKSQDEVLNFQPKIKRVLNISPVLGDLTEGLGSAVEHGTGRSVRANFMEEPILGKTGTCSNGGTRYGWFAAYANTQHGRIVTVVFLRGGRPTYGPKAAEITGKIYRTLYDRSFFAARSEPQEGEPEVGAAQ
jgi:penicillin-binding protein 2